MPQNDVTCTLLRFFPDRGPLTYEEFIHEDESGMDLWSHIYEYDERTQKAVFAEISRPWSEICWLDVAKAGGLGNDSWMLPCFLNKKSFIRLFPSLLNFTYIAPTIEYKMTTLCENYINCFINQLDLSFIREDWKKDFYFSLDDEVKKIVYLALENSMSWTLGIKEVIDSYWYQWRE